MESIRAQIHTLVQSADDVSRLAILRELRNVESEIQAPYDKLMSFANMNMLIAMFRLAVDLRVFPELTKSQSPLSVAQLAESTKSSPELLERVLRYLAANGMIQETGANEYRANATSYIFAEPRSEAMARHGFDMFGPVIQAMPAFFAEHKYQEITSNRNTPFQKAHNTNLTCFEWLLQNPKHFHDLQQTMTILEGAEWTKDFELLEQEAKKITPGSAAEIPFFVDVGGGYGHQCIQLGKEYPNLLGHLVLQDLPAAINRLPPIEGVRLEASDFFQGQSIKGAKFYYLRRILHDWPDKEALLILQNIASSMSPDSRVLVDDVVIPDTNASWQAGLADLAMMFSFGGKERTFTQWNRLADQAGLRVEMIHSYAAITYTAIVVMTLK